MPFSQEIVKGPDVLGRLLFAVLNAFSHTGSKVDRIITRIKEIIKYNGILCISKFNTVCIVGIIGGIFYIIGGYIFTVKDSNRVEGRIADCNIANINIFSSADYNQVRAVIVGHLFA